MVGSDTNLVQKTHIFLRFRVGSCAGSCWGRTPRTVVHDKASYMVAPMSQRLASGDPSVLRSCGAGLGPTEDDGCSWLAGRLGDVYPHETVINHIRRGLRHNFP